MYLLFNIVAASQKKAITKKKPSHRWKSHRYFTNCDVPLNNQKFQIWKFCVSTTTLLCLGSFHGNKTKQTFLGRTAEQGYLWNPDVSETDSVSIIRKVTLPTATHFYTHYKSKLGRNFAWLKPSTVAKTNSFIFWVIKRFKVVWNRRFGITYRSHLQGSSCKIIGELENGTDR